MTPPSLGKHYFVATGPGAEAIRKWVSDNADWHKAVEDFAESVIGSRLAFIGRAFGRGFVSALAVKGDAKERPSRPGLRASPSGYDPDSGCWKVVPDKRTGIGRALATRFAEVAQGPCNQDYLTTFGVSDHYIKDGRYLLNVGLGLVYGTPILVMPAFASDTPKHAEKIPEWAYHYLLENKRLPSEYAHLVPPEPNSSTNLQEDP